jgi:hypothetical protein
MQDICDNFVTIKHSDPKFIAKIVKDFKDGSLFGGLYPRPKHVPEERDASWKIGNWGVSHDVGIDQRLSGQRINSYELVNPNYVALRFETKFAPPISYYENLMGDFDAEIDAMFFATRAKDDQDYCGSYNMGHYDDLDIVSRTHKWAKTHIPPEVETTLDIAKHYADREDQVEEQINLSLVY